MLNTSLNSDKIFYSGGDEGYPFLKLKNKTTPKKKIEDEEHKNNQNNKKMK